MKKANFVAVQVSSVANVVITRDLTGQLLLYLQANDTRNSDFLDPITFTEVAFALCTPESTNTLRNL